MHINEGVPYIRENYQQEYFYPQQNDTQSYGYGHSYFSASPNTASRVLAPGSLNNTYSSAEDAYKQNMQPAGAYGSGSAESGTNYFKTIPNLVKTVARVYPGSA